MLGKRKNYFSFADIGFGRHIPENSFWNKLRQWALKYLEEDMFADLFLQYRQALDFSRVFFLGTSNPTGKRIF